MADRYIIDMARVMGGFFSTREIADKAYSVFMETILSVYSRGE